MPFLLVRNDGGETRRVELKGIAVVGRAGSCDVPIKDTQASRKHARVFTDGRQYFVEDLSSRNGTYVNGARVDGRVGIRHGDQIRIGSHQLTFQDGSGEPAPVLPPRTSRAGAALAQAQDEVARFFGGILFFLLLVMIFGATAILSKVVFVLVLSGL